MAPGPSCRPSFAALVAALVAVAAALALAAPPPARADLEPPRISGDAVVGSTLTARPDDDDDDDDAPLVFEWFRSPAGTLAAAGPSRTYVVTLEDVGHRLVVRVVDPATGAFSDWSRTTRVVPAPDGPPENLSRPSISDRSPEVGDRLRADVGRWTGGEPMAFSVTWLACNPGCRPVGTGETYTVQRSDAGHRLRVVVAARNAAGRREERSDLTRAVPAVVDPPLATTVGVTDVTATTAVVRGTVDPRGLASSFRVDYGTTTAYGAATAPVPVAAAAVAVPVEATLTGLAPGTTYHVRVVATNTAGTAAGANATFSTAVPATSAPPPTPTPPGPAVRNFVARVDANVVRLSWTATDAAGRPLPVVVVRRFGRKPTAPGDGTVVHRGRAQRAIDFPVARRRVWYAAFVTRPAAPRTAAFTSVRRFYPSLLSPYHRATVGRRVRFLWRPVRRASYYNIQIWDDRLRRRLVARWPRARTLTLRLPPGRYRWYVYPGFGAQRNARYGDLWGQGSFTVRR